MRYASGMPSDSFPVLPDVSLGPTAWPLCTDLCKLLPTAAWQARGRVANGQRTAWMGGWRRSRAGNTSPPPLAPRHRLTPGSAVSNHFLSVIPTPCGVEPVQDREQETKGGSVADGGREGEQERYCIERGEAEHEQHVLRATRP